MVPQKFGSTSKSLSTRPPWRDPSPVQHSSDELENAENSDISESELITFEDEVEPRSSIYLDEAKKFQAAGWRNNVQEFEAKNSSSSDKSLELEEDNYCSCVELDPTKFLASLQMSGHPLFNKIDFTTKRVVIRKVSCKNLLRHSPSIPKLSPRASRRDTLRAKYSPCVESDLIMVGLTDELYNALSQATRDIRVAKGRTGKGRKTDSDNREKQGTKGHSTYPETKGHSTHQETKGHSTHQETKVHSTYPETKGHSTHHETKRHSTHQETKRHSTHQETKGHSTHQETKGHSTHQETKGHSTHQETKCHSTSQETKGHSAYQEIKGTSTYPETKGHSTYPETKGHSTSQESKGHSTYQETKRHSTYPKTKGHSTYQKPKRSPSNTKYEAKCHSTVHEVKGQSTYPEMKETKKTNHESKSPSTLQTPSVQKKAIKRSRIPRLTRNKQESSCKVLSPTDKSIKLSYGPPQAPEYIIQRPSCPPRPLTRGYGFTNVTRSYLNPVTKSIYTTKQNISTFMLPRVLTANKTTRVSLSDVEEVMASASPSPCRLKKSAKVKSVGKNSRGKSGTKNVNLIRTPNEQLEVTCNVQKKCKSPLVSPRGYRTHREFSKQRMFQVAETSRRLKASSGSDQPGYKSDCDMSDDNEGIPQQLQYTQCQAFPAESLQLTTPSCPSRDFSKCTWPLDGSGDCPVRRGPIHLPISEIKLKEDLADQQDEISASQPLRTETRTLRTWTPKSWKNRNRLSKYPLPTISPPPSAKAPSVCTIQPFSRTQLPTKRIPTPKQCKSDETTYSARTRKKLETTKGMRGGFYGGGCLRNSYQPTKPLVPPKGVVPKNKTLTNKTIAPTSLPPKVPLKSSAGKNRYLQAEIVKSNHQAYLQRIRNAKPSQAIANAFSRKQQSTK